MFYYYSRIPSAAVKPMFDGNLYAHIPHSIAGDIVIENFDKPRMLRYTEPDSFIKNGEAYILFAKRGDAIALAMPVPFGVTVLHVEDEQKDPYSGRLDVAS